MDTEYDFIQPEFFNILFFEQKNLVIFPYIDLKHLHSLELFAVGHNIIDLESTALYNLKEIIEFEASNSYSQNRNFYFVYNLDYEKIKDITTIPDFRCVLNVNENFKINQNVSNLVNGDNFIFYNKKNKKFLNYDKSNSDLEFETHLITTSENKAVLQDKIQKIKTTATRIFTEINYDPNLSDLPEILKDYDQKSWIKILNFVKFYFKIEVPDIKNLNFNVKRTLRNSSQLLKDFSREYEQIVVSNKNIAREFIQLLHEYRSQKVNPSNLDLEQLYDPQKLYNYLRNHHWSKGIPEFFLKKWLKMENTKYNLNSEDVSDFETIFVKIGVSKQFILENVNNLFVPSIKINSEIENSELDFSPEIQEGMIAKNSISLPSPTTNFTEFRTWCFNILKKIDELLGVKDIIDKKETDKK
ncbi:MAG: hypothetical protein ACFFAN_13755 [Promethearchaeota archaeon]